MPVLDLTIYSRADCHLCREMEGELAELTRGHSVRITIVDVDSDPDLRRRFGLRVPVLATGDEEVCAARLVPERIAALLRADD